MKIYLAGNDSPGHSEVLHRIGYPYRLASHLNLGNGKSRDETLEFAKDGSDWIMDSGLFTFMFGAGKGKLKTYDDYKKYATEYVESMLKCGWKHAVVECDVQKVLGVDETLRLRDDIFRPSGLETVYVWHIEEGIEGLKKLAATEKRIALSVPELRQVSGRASSIGGLPVRKMLISLLKTVYEAGSPRVHLLGNTETDLVRLRADSCDSTSWLYVIQYALAIMYAGGGRLDRFNAHSERWKAWLAWCSQRFPLTGEEYKDWLVGTAVSYWLLMDYTNENGASDA